MRICRTGTEVARDVPSSFIADAEGTLWLGMGNGLVLRQQAGAWKEFNRTNRVPFSYIYCLAQRPPGEI